ncbi:hypothetical protein [Agrobacterium sp. CG674]
MRKPQVDTAIRKEIDNLLERSGKLFASGALQSSLSVALEAWDLIPEPKEAWDYYGQSLSAGFVLDYADLGDKRSCQKWIEIMALMYDDLNHEDHYVLMQEGEAMYKLGDIERAFYVFSRVEELYGARGFKGEQKAYLTFIREERGKRAASSS